MTSPSASNVLAPTLPKLEGYTLFELLYVGSRTIVYRGLQNDRQQPVAIKVLRRDYPSFNEIVQFRNQYTIAKSLDLPGIVRPLKLEAVGNSEALIMEDFGGIALSQYLSQQSLTLAEILEIAIQLADILHAIAQQRVVHKDIKPANILIHPPSKQIKLIDFSIASLLPKETQEIQNPNILEGTLAYLAPEQTGRMNRGIDYRADFYSLGVTLYQLLTGTLPFEASDPLELMHCHIAKIPPRVDRVNREIPAMVGAIIAKLMAKNAEDRYQSALGLKHDLEKCLKSWQATGTIAEFELAERDLSDRFLIPEKLYGRQAEVQTLLQAFDRVAAGGTELMLVAGFSGIGKTAVVNEVHKPIVRQRGYFIKGKFDQFNRNIPFSAFVQALRDLMGQLLCEADVQLHQWKARILEAVGETGQVLIEVIPELERVIGPQPEVAELSGSAAENRFNLLFHKFIGIFTRPEHPLVLFLDDLQWADSASLKLMKVLMEDNGYLLVLGAYRDNEVSADHPFILTVEALERAQAIVKTITLQPLAFEDTNDLIADTLHCSRELALPLSELVNRKTKGNPFFTTQFLKALHEEGQIRFDRDRRYWECDIARVNALALTDDVVEFMATQLQKLSLKTQNILKLAACIGNQFDLKTLAIVSEQSQTEVAIALWSALQEGLVLPTSQVYKFFQDSEQGDVEDKIDLTYRFLHDRVQQAAYSLIPNSQKAETHLKIGRLLLQDTPPEQRQTNIFPIVNQLNCGTALLEGESEKYELAELNLIAAQKATRSAAYEAAFRYIQIALKLLSENSWQTRYQLTLDIYNLAAELAFLNGEFERMEVWASCVLERAKTAVDKIDVYAVRVQADVAQIKKLEAIKLGLEALELLGVSFPPNLGVADMMQSLAQTAQKLEGKKIADLIHLPVMTDPQQLIAFKMLNSVGGSAFQAAPLLFTSILCKMIDLSLEYGNCSFASYAYSCYGCILGAVFQDLEGNYEFGQLALKVGNFFNAPDCKSAGFMVTAGTGMHVKVHLKETLPILWEAYHSGIEGGNFEYAGYAATIKSIYSYFCGLELKQIEREIETMLDSLTKLKQAGNVRYNQHVLRCVLKLQYPLNSSEFLPDVELEETEAILTLKKDNDRTGLHLFYIAKLTVSYLLGGREESLKNALECEQYLDGVPGYYYVPLFAFYDSLAHLAIYPSLPDSERESCWNRGTKNQEKLQLYALHAPMNFQHKFDLVEAQRQQILGNKTEALDLYDRAISGAKENGYIQEEAIARELAAKFYLEWDKELVAAGYMQQAYYCYSRWGARAKVQDLEQRYPQLLAPILQPQYRALSATQTAFEMTPLTTFQAVESHSSTAGSTSISAALDLATVLKASQTLSGEIELDKLLATLLRLVLENAGADKGALLMPRDNEWFIEALAIIEQPVRVQSIPLASSREVSQSIVNRVKRGLQPIAIADVTLHPLLVGELDGMQQPPKSLLCTPIVQQGKAIAILYLENRVTAGAFTEDRLQLLNLLCAQAAISLENARLYQQSLNYAQQLEQSQLQIIQSEKMASLGNLVAGVAHEINNPVGFLNGSINNGKDYIQDILGHLALYQQHYPQPAVEIIENEEDIDLEYVSEDLPKLLDSMQGATDRIKSISNSLRTFSRADTENPVLADIHEGLDSTLLILKYRLKANEYRPAIQVVKNYGTLPPIECFPGQLNQVFMNILANAIDVLDEAARESDYATLGANPQQIAIKTESVEGNAIAVHFRDNGKGIAEEIQARIFDHLFTTKGVGKGTGLGLAIARQIAVEKHQGSLEVQSNPSCGTDFILRLPIKQGCGGKALRAGVTGF